MLKGSTVTEDMMAPIRSAVVRYFALLAGAAVLALLVTVPFREEPPVVIASYLALLVIFFVAHKVRLPRPLLAGALCSLGPLILITLMVTARGGMANPAAMASYITLVLVTGLTWNSRGTLLVAVLSSATIGYFVIVAPVETSYPKLQQWAEFAIQLVIVWGIVRLTLVALAKSSNESLSHQKRFQDALEASPDGMISLDREGNIVLFNAQAVKMSRVAAENARGNPLSKLGWLEDAALADLDELLLTLPESEVAQALEVSDSKGLLLEVRASLINTPGAPSEQLISLRDVTERRQAEQAQEVLDSRVAHSRSIDALGRLAGGVAHDFNNMLTIIGGTSEMMRVYGDVHPRLADDINRIEGAAQRAGQLTAQLLAFGRKQVLEPRVLSLGVTLSHLRPLLERLVPANIRLRLETENDVGHVRFDEARLEQVIVNLVSNASDAMADGGELTISVKAGTTEEASPSGQLQPGVCAELIVKDTGVGMSDETLAHLFEPFYSTKTDEGGRGTGLGLATVHGIVAQSGGRIYVESTLGEGTEFRIQLPLTSAPLSSAAAKSEAPQPRLATGRVLLVEDEPGVRTATKRMLEALGYEVETAEDGQHALDTFSGKVRSFRYLVTDVVMPQVNGPDLAVRLKELHPALRVLFVSGYTQQAITNDGVLDEGVHYLPKPFNMGALSKKMSEIE